jgi:hypothetical protein
MTEYPWWRKSLLEAMDNMTVEDLVRVLEAWNAAEPGKRPNRRELWYRGKRWRKSTEFVERALGREQAATFAKLDGGGLGESPKDLRPHWMRTGGGK